MASETGRVTYTCEGDIRGSCDHRHRTLDGAIRCWEADQSGCASQGGHSDRRIVRSDGEAMIDCGADGWMTADEASAIDDEDIERRNADDDERRAWGR